MLALLTPFMQQYTQIFLCVKLTGKNRFDENEQNIIVVMMMIMMMMNNNVHQVKQAIVQYCDCFWEIRLHEYKRHNSVKSNDNLFNIISLFQRAPQLSGFVSAVPGSNPKHTIYSFSICCQMMYNTCHCVDKRRKRENKKEVELHFAIYNGQRLWFSWQSGCFQFQRSAV